MAPRKAPAHSFMFIHSFNSVLYLPCARYNLRVSLPAGYLPSPHMVTMIETLPSVTHSSRLSPFSELPLGPAHTWRGTELGAHLGLCPGCRIPGFSKLPVALGSPSRVGPASPTIADLHTGNANWARVSGSLEPPGGAAGPGEAGNGHKQAVTFQFASAPPIPTSPGSSPS